MPEILRICPLCEQDKFSVFDQRIFRGYEVTNVLCSNCGLVFQSPRMEASELEDFYQDEYRTAYQGQEGPSDRDLRIQKMRAENLVNLLKDTGTERVARYLDIGSSAGLLLEEIQDAFGCQVAGIEPGDAYREYARSKGLSVYEDLSQIEALEDGRFDLVSMVHVLEHIPDSVGYLQTLREKHLKPGARLLVEVPNLYAHDCFEVAHLTSFSLATLTQVMIKAGYRTTYIERHGFPLSKMIPLYITLIAEPTGERPGSEELDLERYVSVKRRTGFFHRRIIERFFPHYGWVSEFRT